MSFKKEVMEKLSSIEFKVHEVTIQQSLNNKILDEHHKRSTHLEERIKPLEESQVFFNKLSKALIALAAVAASLLTVYSHFFSK